MADVRLTCLLCLRLTANALLCDDCERWRERWSKREEN
jgi:hypothetical protein